jgi:large subunit ribosomal protein L4
MATFPIYNVTGEKNGTIELSDRVFAVAPKMPLIHQVYEAIRANAREPWADTKDRGEVRGGGKKPWKQKGTGRARHGSTHSPIRKISGDIGETERTTKKSNTAIISSTNTNKSIKIARNI